MLKGVPQRSVLGPILLNIYLNNLFYFLLCDVCNFADDTTPYACDKNLEFVLTKLENHSDIVIKWFENNYMKMNSEKCHPLISGHIFENLLAKIGNDKIWETRTVTVLGITINNKLKFDENLHNVCLKANRKFSALMKIRKFLYFDKTRILKLRNVPGYCIHETESF